MQKVGKGFHPKHLNCSHYSWMHRSSSNGEARGYELGTWMSFDVPKPNHVQYLCKECEKPNGNCGVGLNCLCHAKSLVFIFYFTSICLIYFAFIQAGDYEPMMIFLQKKDHIRKWVHEICW